MSQDRYEIKGKLGQGGIGAVYRAFDKNLNRDVAIKRIVPDGSDMSQEEATQSLLKEAKSLSALQHPNIVTVYDVGLDDDGPYVVMEILEGRTIEEMISQGTFVWEDFREVVMQTMEAMIAAQDLDMVHRDLKPANIMVVWLPSGRFQIKLVDFGLAKFSPTPSLQTMDHGHSVFGSIYFMAPEQFERRPIDCRTDLYALGCIFYFALTGQYPFDGTSAPQVMAAHLQHSVVPLADLRPDLPVWACDWVMWMIERNMDYRPANAREALKKFLELEKNPQQALAEAPVVEAPRELTPQAAGPISPLTQAGQVGGVVLKTGATLVKAGNSRAVNVQSSLKVQTTSANKIAANAPANQPVSAIGAQNSARTATVSGSKISANKKKLIIILSSVAGVLLLAGGGIKLGLFGSSEQEPWKVYNSVISEVKGDPDKKITFTADDAKLKVLFEYLTKDTEKNQDGKGWGAVVEYIARCNAPSKVAMSLDALKKSDYSAKQKEGLVANLNIYSKEQLRGNPQYFALLSDDNSQLANYILQWYPRTFTVDQVEGLANLMLNSNKIARDKIEGAVRVVLESSAGNTGYGDKLKAVYDKASDEDVKRSLLRAVAPSGSAWAYSVVKDMLSSKDVNKEIAAISILGDWGNEKDALSALESIYSNNSLRENTRVTAFNAACNLLTKKRESRDESLLESFCKTLQNFAQSNNKANFKRTLMSNLVAALSNMPNKPWVLEMLGAIEKDPDNDISFAAEKALEKVRKNK